MPADHDNKVRPSSREWKQVLLICAVGLLVLYALLISSFWWGHGAVTTRFCLYVVTMPAGAMGYLLGMLYGASLPTLRKRLIVLVPMSGVFMVAMVLWRVALGGR